MGTSLHDDNHHFRNTNSTKVKCWLTGHFENRLFRISFLPSNMCGMTNISSDISSIRLFCSGVPVSRIRCSAWVQKKCIAYYTLPSSYVHTQYYSNQYFFISNGMYIDCLSLSYATSVVIRVVIVIRRGVQSVFHHFCPSLPVSLTSVLLVNRHIAPDGFCPWVRVGCIACRMGRARFWCSEDVYPNSHAQHTNKICNCLSSWPVCCVGYFSSPWLLG
jgi:hypothetical protein